MGKVFAKVQDMGAFRGYRFNPLLNKSIVTVIQLKMCTKATNVNEP